MSDSSGSISQTVPESLPDRQTILAALSEKSWFKLTDKQLQQELIGLPADFDGFLRDLSGRPDRIGLVEIIRLVKLSRGNYMIVSVFEVRSVHTKQLFTYEYVSWKHGRLGGYKGIILLESENKIRHFLVKVGEKFPIAELTYDAIGTNQFSPLVPSKFFLQSNVENQIKKLLEVDEIPVSRYLDLGIINPDPSMTNNCVGLFAMILNADHVKDLEKHVTNRHFTHLPVGYRIELHPISELFDFISKCNDSFFLACFSRLLASHVVSI